MVVEAHVAVEHCPVVRAADQLRHAVAFDRGRAAQATAWRRGWGGTQRQVAVLVHAVERDDRRRRRCGLGWRDSRCAGRRWQRRVGGRWQRRICRRGRSLAGAEFTAWWRRRDRRRRGQRRLRRSAVAGTERTAWRGGRRWRGRHLVVVTAARQQEQASDQQDTTPASRQHQQPHRCQQDFPQVSASCRRLSNRLLACVKQKTAPNTVEATQRYSLCKDLW